MRAAHARIRVEIGGQLVQAWRAHDWAAVAERRLRTELATRGPMTSIQR
jgi:hypothetical protein